MRVRVLALAVFMTLCCAPSLTAPVKQSQSSQDYEDRTDKRIAENEDIARDDRDRAKDDRIEIKSSIKDVRARVDKNSAALETLNDLAKEIQFVRRWIAWLIGFATALLGALALALWKAGWKYIPPAWAWLKHLHECMDANRDAVQQLSEKMDGFEEDKHRWRLKIDGKFGGIMEDLKHLRQTDRAHADALLGLGMAQAIERVSEVTVKTSEITVSTNEVAVETNAAVHRIKDKIKTP
jgi:hypothetical protein